MPAAAARVARHIDDEDLASGLIELADSGGDLPKQAVRDAQAEAQAAIPFAGSSKGLPEDEPFAPAGAAEVFLVEGPDPDESEPSAFEVEHSAREAVGASSLAETRDRLELEGKVLLSRVIEAERLAGSLRRRQARKEQVGSGFRIERRRVRPAQRQVSVAEGSDEAAQDLLGLFVGARM